MRIEQCIYNMACPWVYLIGNIQARSHLVSVVILFAAELPPSWAPIHSEIAHVNYQLIFGVMSPSPITWGAGLSIVLGSLPSLVLPPATAISLPWALEKALPLHLTPEWLSLFLDLPTTVRSIVALGLLAVVRSFIGGYRRRLDRKRFGPDVIELPKIKLKWPLNLDFIPFDSNIMQNGKLGAMDEKHASSCLQSIAGLLGKS
jgi:hypothetical protein